VCFLKKRKKKARYLAREGKRKRGGRASRIPQPAPPPPQTTRGQWKILKEKRGKATRRRIPQGKEGKWEKRVKQGEDNDPNIDLKSWKR